MRNELLLQPFSEDEAQEGGGGNGKKARMQGWSTTESILDQYKNRIFFGRPISKNAPWLLFLVIVGISPLGEREAAATQYVADGDGAGAS